MPMHQVLKRLSRSILLTLGLLAALWPAVVRAQPLADRAPADTMLFVSWQGADALQPAYANSRLKAVIDSTDAGKILDDFLPKLMERIAQEQGGDVKQFAEAGKVFNSFAGPLWHYPTALCFAGVDLKAKMPRLVFLSQAGKDATKLRDQLRGLMKDAPREAKDAIEIEQIDDLLVVTLGYPEAKAALGTKEKSLATAPEFKSAAEQVGKAPAAMFYLNVERMLDLIDEVVGKEAPDEAKELWPKVRNATGLAGLKRIAWTTGFDGKDWGDHVFVAAPAPRKGLLTLMDSEPVSDTAFSAIPSTATVAAAARFDLAKLIPVIRKASAEVDPNAGQAVDDFLKMIVDQVKLDIQKDLFSALGDEWAYYTAPDIGGRGMAGVVFINRVRDEKKLTESLETIQKLIADEINKEVAKNGTPIKLGFYKSQTDGLTINYVGTPLITPSWAIQDGNLYVGLFPQTVSAAAAHVHGKGKSILDNKDFTAMRERLGGQKATAVAFVDLPKTAPDAYSQWLMISRLSGFADMFGVQSPTMLLPPMHKLMAHLTPAGQASWVDDAGYHARSLAPFPGAILLGNEPFGAMFLPSALAGLASEHKAATHAAEPAEPPRAIEPPKIELPGAAPELRPPDVAPPPPPAPR